ncbi:hypothetical protein FOA52_016071 [Chlamydomonas sp. UWO 241]|nr:hypothetical protein FOA52_016071 [Chlamydomonas sp. UWO 241]
MLRASSTADEETPAAGAATTAAPSAGQQDITSSTGGEAMTARARVEELWGPGSSDRDAPLKLAVAKAMLKKGPSYSVEAAMIGSQRAAVVRGEVLDASITYAVATEILAADPCFTIVDKNEGGHLKLFRLNIDNLLLAARAAPVAMRQPVSSSTGYEAVAARTRRHHVGRTSVMSFDARHHLALTPLPPGSEPMEGGMAEAAAGGAFGGARARSDGVDIGDKFSDSMLQALPPRIHEPLRAFVTERARAEGPGMEWHKLIEIAIDEERVRLLKMLARDAHARGGKRATSARGPSRRGGLPARVGDTSLRRSFVLSIPVARGANWFLVGGGRRMDEEEATAAAAERIAAAAEDGTSLPARLATDVVRFLYGGTGRREPADGGVVSASLLNAKPAVGGIGVEPRGGGVLRVLFTVASDAVADTVVRWRHELRRCVDSTAVFDVLSDREEAQHQALWPAFLAAKVAGKRAQFHRARLVVDGERVPIVEAIATLRVAKQCSEAAGRLSAQVPELYPSQHGGVSENNASGWSPSADAALFTSDGRLGLPGTLHRISRGTFNRHGTVHNLMYRVGRHVPGIAAISTDLLAELCSPAGKTTLLRDITRMLADVFDNAVNVVDTSNEIAGDYVRPHACIGSARRFMVPNRRRQNEVLVEVVQNHTPQVIVVDEIGTPQEVRAIRTISQRGVIAVGTAHSTDLSSLLDNHELSDLVGGIETVTLGDEQAAKGNAQSEQRESMATENMIVQPGGGAVLRQLAEQRCGLGSSDVAGPLKLAVVPAMLHQGPPYIMGCTAIGALHKGLVEDTVLDASVTWEVALGADSCFAMTNEHGQDSAFRLVVDDLCLPAIAAAADAGAAPAHGTERQGVASSTGLGCETVAARARVEELWGTGSSDRAAPLKLVVAKAMLNKGPPYGIRSDHIGLLHAGLVEGRLLGFDATITWPAALELLSADACFAVVDDSTATTAATTTERHDVASSAGGEAVAARVQVKELWGPESLDRAAPLKPALAEAMLRKRPPYEIQASVLGSLRKGLNESRALDSTITWAVAVALIDADPCFTSSWKKGRTLQLSLENLRQHWVAARAVLVRGKLLGVSITDAVALELLGTDTHFLFVPPFDARGGQENFFQLDVDQLDVDSSGALDPAAAAPPAAKRQRTAPSAAGAASRPSAVRVPEGPAAHTRERGTATRGGGRGAAKERQRAAGGSSEQRHHAGRTYVMAFDARHRPALTALPRMDEPMEGGGAEAAGAALGGVLGDGDDSGDDDDVVDSMLLALPSRIREQLRAYVAERARDGPGMAWRQLVEIAIDEGRDILLRFRSGRRYSVPGLQVPTEEAIATLKAVKQRSEAGGRQPAQAPELYPSYHGGVSGEGALGWSPGAEAALFTSDGRLGLPGTLHRISRGTVDRHGTVYNLTYRVGRHVPGIAAIFADLLAELCSPASGQRPGPAGLHSLLLVGPPGKGNHAAARHHAHARRRDCCGRPHPCIGSARRFMVPDRTRQDEVLVEVVQNHTPEVIVVDEIGTPKEVSVIRTISQRGVITVGTAHGTDLSSLLNNHELSDLVGGIETVTLGDMQAVKVNGGQKTRQERARLPSFTMLMEVLAENRWRVHRNVAASVDLLLAAKNEARGRELAPYGGKVSHDLPRTETRAYDAAGRMLVEMH